MGRWPNHPELRKSYNYLVGGMSIWWDEHLSVLRPLLYPFYMEIDLELYRREVRVSHRPPVNLSVIDISPDQPARTLVFLHGFGGEALQWRYQLQTFSLHNRAIAIDLRGHGDSDRPANGYTMDRLLDDLVAALDVLGVAGKFTLFGHSFGGAIATEFALRHPQRIEHLILTATAGEFHLNPIYRSLLRLPATTLRPLERFTDDWLGAPPQVLRALYHQSLKNWRGWDLFKRLTVPTLVVRGHQDRVFDRKYFDSVVQDIPGAVEVDVGYSGHMVMIERRDAFNRAIANILDTSHRSWRQQAGIGNQADLINERPWLSQYDVNVPYTVAIPAVPLPELLASAARRFPNNPAIIYEDYKLSYQQLYQYARQFAKGLHSAGLNAGDRVLIHLSNHPALVVAFYGVLLAGGVVVFTPPETGEDELVGYTNNTETRFILLMENRSHFVHRLAAESGVERIVMVEQRADLSWAESVSLFPQESSLPGGLMLRFADLLHGQAEEPQSVEARSGETAVILFTGGTTAAPKGVILSHRNLVANTLQIRHWMPEAKEGHEIFLTTLSLTHSYGLMTGLCVPISLGATIILKTQFEVMDILQAIRAYRPTIFPGVPAMYLAINNAPGVRNYQIDSIKACLSGSAPLPVEVQEAFERLTRGRLIEGYGVTEASPVTHANPLNGLRVIGSIGIPLPSTEARIVDLKKPNKTVPTGHIGELAIRGPQVMLGYWSNPGATAEVITPEGWLLTGDVVQMDPNGYFRLIARKADMWYPERPGEPAFPRDVEEVLYEIPQVKEAVVVAVAGQPIAFIIAGQEKPSREAVLAYCQRRLPPNLVPKLVILMDNFPRSYIGKVLRRELVRHYQELQKSEGGSSQAAD